MAQTLFNSRHRRHARLSAVQALYKMDIVHAKSKLVVSEFNAHWFKNAEPETVPTDTTYFELIVLGVVAHQETIDSAVSDKLKKDWSLKRLDSTLRAILRCAAFEILHQSEIPSVVIIDQYVSITGDFCDEREQNFVNAALDRLAREQRPGEFGVPQTGP